mmetsp:Transcript_40894/g.128426  ORF Transcript_40894/g.128426 Transcript_40894/m.128426 type:complete len:455 (-) Transcript_40894:1373-2737(-)
MHILGARLQVLQDSAPRQNPGSHCQGSVDRTASSLLVALLGGTTAAGAEPSAAYSTDSTRTYSKKESERSPSLSASAIHCSSAASSIGAPHTRKSFSRMAPRPTSPSSFGSRMANPLYSAHTSASVTPHCAASASSSARGYGGSAPAPRSAPLDLPPPAEAGAGAGPCRRRSNARARPSPPLPRREAKRTAASTASTTTSVAPARISGAASSAVRARTKMGTSGKASRSRSVDSRQRLSLAYVTTIARGRTMPAARSSSGEAPSPYTTRTCLASPTAIRDGLRSNAMNCVPQPARPPPPSSSSANTDGGSGHPASASASTSHARCPISPYPHTTTASGAVASSPPAAPCRSRCAPPAAASSSAAERCSPSTRSTKPLRSSSREMTPSPLRSSCAKSSAKEALPSSPPSEALPPPPSKYRRSSSRSIVPLPSASITSKSSSAFASAAWFASIRST